MANKRTTFWDNTIIPKIMLVISLFMIVFSAVFILKKSNQKEQKLVDKVESLEVRLSLIESKQK
ncbi:hypothetical protein MTsPCn5_17060 [Croceitalea sp. MTPC5]|uniref:hypothetical protein n=1 Tax=Croceitalea sp. MTPC5 TaxID=3056565 RepID=UPI002B3E7EEE|nr:hypothetical protein MTsPCn5_17060 [Croceitalea sp. MTPC5]